MSTSNPTPNIGGLGTSSTGSSGNAAPDANAVPNLFSNIASNPSQSTKPPPIFGQTSTLGSTTAPTIAPASSSPFGTSFASLASKPATPSGGLFGAPKDNNNTNALPSSFTPPSTTTNTLFGNTQSTSTASAPVKSPFSNLPTGSLFGSGSGTSALQIAEVPKDPKACDKIDADAQKSGNKSNALVPSGSATMITSSTTVPAPSMLRGKSVEDIVNRWSTDLEIQARAFSQFASEVAVWDRALVENGDYISALYAAVLQAESTQTSLDQTLEHVEQQQRQLISTLDQYEKIASEILHGPTGIMASTEGLGLADSERDKSYALAANLYTQLDDLSNSLTQMVEAVNGLNISFAPKAASGEDSDEDPISTIAGILNAHLSSLQWIDTYLRDMESKVKDAERKIREVANTRSSDGFSKVRSFGLTSRR